MSVPNVAEPKDDGLRIADVLLAMKKLWTFMRPYRGKFALGIFLLLLAVPLAQFAIFLTRDVTNQALTATHLTSEQRWDTVVRIISLQAVFWLASNLLSTWREVLEWYVSMRSTFDLRVKFYKHLHSLPMSFLSKRTPGEHLYRATSDMVSMFRIGNRLETSTPAGQMPPESKEVQMTYYYSNDVDPFDPGVMGIWSRSIPLFVETLYSLTWGASLLYLIDPFLSLLLFVYVVPFTIVSHYAFNRVRHAAFDFKAAVQTESGVLRDSLAGLKTLKALARTKLQLGNYYRASSLARRQGVRMGFELVRTQSLLQQGMRWTFTTGLYIYLANRIVQGQATIGDWVATALLIESAQMPLQNFVQLIQLLKMQLVPAQRIIQTLDEKPTLADRPGAIALESFQGRIEFKNVSFSYNAERPAIIDLSLAIEPGEYLGIVGPSGAGKSSLVALALRLYKADSGTVSIDNNDILDVKLRSYLANVGAVPQSTFLYTGTIAENIVFGNPDATEDELYAAIEAAGISKFLLAHDDGVNTLIGEESGLSGGERQRIGIARALIRNPKMLVLDEATASLDPTTEENILETIESIRKDRTILTIAHRLKAVATCDRIIVLEQGRIEQIGTHRELVQVEGIYRSLWREQSKDHSGAGASHD